MTVIIYCGSMVYDDNWCIGFFIRLCIRLSLSYTVILHRNDVGVYLKLITRLNNNHKISSH